MYLLGLKEHEKKLTNAVVNNFKVVRNCVPYLALADGAFGGIFIPGRAA